MYQDLHSLKLTVRPLKWWVFQVRNLQTSRGPTSHHPPWAAWTAGGHCRMVSQAMASTAYPGCQVDVGGLPFGRNKKNASLHLKIGYTPKKGNDSRSNYPFSGGYVSFREGSGYVWGGTTSDYMETKSCETSPLHHSNGWDQSCEDPIIYPTCMGKKQVQEL